MKKISKIALLLVAATAATVVLTACKSDNAAENKEESKDNPVGPAVEASAEGAAESSVDASALDILNGTWKQTDETNGDWVWTFDGAGKCHLTGITTGFETDGVYKLDTAAGTVNVTMESWSDPKTYNYTLDGTTLDLSEKYSHYHLIKQ